MEPKQMEQERLERVKHIFAQEQANRKLLKLNLIETVSSIFDNYEELLQRFMALQNENAQLKKLLEEKKKQPTKGEKPVSKLLERKKKKK